MKNSKQHIKAGDLSADHYAEYDVVIIGSGAGGGISAEMFSQAGLKVAIVEKGPYHDKSDFSMEEGKAYVSLYQDVASKKTKDKAINIFQGRCVGGGTTVNWTASFRTPEKTLTHWQQKFAVKNCSTNDLKPYFEKVERRLNIDRWPINNRNNDLLLIGAKNLGWHATQLNRNVKGCANLGYCGMGCPIDAKQSMLVSTLPSAMKNGAVLYSELEAWKLIGDGRKIDALEAKVLDEDLISHKKIKVQLKAKTFIIASGAIASPGLMLRSNFKDPHETIGKRTFLHPVVLSAGIYDQPINAYKGAPQSSYSDEFLWRDGVISNKLGYKMEVPPLHPVIVAITFKSFGLNHRDMMAKFANTHVLLALLRDGFNDDEQGGTVSLDKYQQPVLDYPITETLKKSALHALSSMAKMQFSSGAKQVISLHEKGQLMSNEKDLQKHLKATFSKAQFVSAHQMGGCAMGEDKTKTVVDSNGKFHYLDNVYVFDGSVFPTSVGVNPQESIYGLTMKQAENLIIKLQQNS